MSTPFSSPSPAYAALVRLACPLAGVFFFATRGPSRGPLGAPGGGALAAEAGQALGALAPRLGGRPSHGPETQPVGPEAALLAQAEGATHRPVSYASSPSLPGTLNAPWWTDFAHLVYWFYVVATFATVAFLAYLYDLLVRRREAAHPVRETRGFSRAQTGDLVTAVLPLTWSATMVMHASTHSINFDENTAGAAFSFTVIAYQWGWNYYFPRDVVSQMEAAPRVVGRGRVVGFSASPHEAAEAASRDLWAVRATLGSRHASRTGRLNATGSALSLALPTDVPAGALAALPRGASWRAAAFAGLGALGDAAPARNAAPQEGASASAAPMWGLDTATAFTPRPAAFIAGDRVSLGSRHYRAAASAPRAGASLWVAGAGEAGSLLAPAPALLPTPGNLGGALSEGRPVYPLSRTAGGLGFLRAGSSTAPSQLLLWAGPDASTGAGFAALASTEDMGWLTPVPAREALARATLGGAHALAGALPTEGARGVPPGPLLAPFDLAARALFSHLGGGVPFSWVGASAALEAEISSEASPAWALGLSPDPSAGALATAGLGGWGVSPMTGVRAAPAPRGAGAALDLSTMSRAGGAHGACPHTGLGARLCRPLGTITGRRPGSPRLYGPSSPAPTPGTRAFGLVGGPRAPGAAAQRGPTVLVGPTRAAVSPSPVGLGLDESRLVRGAAARLSDPAAIAGRLDSPVGPRSSLPLGPTALLGLGWSSTASVFAYPSFKTARGGLIRRPMSGMRSSPSPLTGLPVPTAAPALGKVGGPVGAGRLALWALAPSSAAPAGSALDGARASWAPAWAFFGPAPTEDLDPTFVNTVWTPETNTTRRSDHNSRYLVTWAPLGPGLVTGGAFSGDASGPAPRGGLAPASVRASLLALNEVGLKNTRGGRGSQAGLGPLTPGHPSLGGSLSAGLWPSLWALTPTFGSSPTAFVGQPAAAAWVSGRAANVVTTRARLEVGSAAGALSGGHGSGQGLTDLLAALDLSSVPAAGHAERPLQGYVPLSSRISASRRLRVTKGISLPSDTPMHIVCGSKDVIHSWAIPGLGVKIDCIPGYNSHRRLLLRWRGAYWGQCMEVCGRYHHWMPIMVNVVHPALFADWCLTFLRGLDSQAHSGAVGPAPAGLGRLMSSLS